MELSRDKIERLTFVKYLFSQAGVQKNLERPLSSSAILTIHDCVECFLQLCYELKTGKTKLTSQNILDTYSEEINKELALNGGLQINKSYIKRINDLRNQLKHSTIFTDHKQIPNLYAETEIFLSDFSLLIFDINFESISIIELLKDDQIKTYLREAERYIHTNEYQKAMWSIGKAFYELEQILIKVEGVYGQNLLRPHHKIDYTSKYRAKFGSTPLDSNLRENLKEIADDVNRLQDEIQNLKHILSLSVNLKDYMIFKLEMPYVSKITNNGVDYRYWIPDEERNEPKEYKYEVVKYCLNFVIEIALKNQ